MDDTLHKMRHIQRAILNWRWHRRQIQRCCQYWLVWLAACDWILNMHINIYCGIDDINLMKPYQINNGLDDSLQDRSIQCSVSNWRRHWGRVQWQRWTIFWIIVVAILIMIWIDIAISISILIAIAITALILILICIWIVIWTDGIELETASGTGLTTKADNIFNCCCYHFDYDLNWYCYFHFDCDFNGNCYCNCNFDFDFNLDRNTNGCYRIEDDRFSFDRDGMRSSVVMKKRHQLYHSCAETGIRTKKVLGGCI